MNHKSQENIVTNSTVAILFVHGILGTPCHFSKFIEILPKNFTYYNILLDGHGLSVSDFSNTNMTKWKNQVEEIFLKIDCENIIIVAHSMGTLFAIDLAIKYNKKIKQLFLLAPPLNITLKPSIVIKALKMLYSSKPQEIQKSYSIEIDRNLSKYIKWIPNYISLFKEISYIKKHIHLLNVPTTAFFSENDELVLKKSKKHLEILPCAEVFLLKNSSHFHYEEQDFKLILKNFNKNNYIKEDF
ncbi:MAG: alpha/beta fold hydrolase [Clostridia bacterium]